MNVRRVLGPLFAPLKKCSWSISLMAIVAFTPVSSLAEGDASDYLTLESVLDGRCQILSEGGKLRVLLNSHTHADINFRLMRVFAGKPQGLTTGVVAPNNQPTKLGCTRVDGREQDWVVERAHFGEEPKP